MLNPPFDLRAPLDHWGIRFLYAGPSAYPGPQIHMRFETTHTFHFAPFARLKANRTLKRGILRQLEEDGLIRYEHEPLSGRLGSGRITFDGALHEHRRSTHEQRQRRREDIASDQA